MEVAALNELLRREFAPVLKLLRAPAGATESTHKSPRANPAATASLAPSTVADSAAAPPSSAVAAATEEMTVAAGPNDPATSVSATVKPAAAAPPAADDPPQLARIDRFRQHCLAVTRRLNAYQYASASAFVQEVEQLSLVARSPEQKQALQVQCLVVVRTAGRVMCELTRECFVCVWDGGTASSCRSAWRR